MEYIFESTRNKENRCSAYDAVIEGIAQDGGLFVRRDTEKIKLHMTDFYKYDYKEIAAIILKAVLSDYPEKIIKECVDKAYIGKFFNEKPAPTVKVGDDYVLELFHGPTSAFKDIALSILPHLTVNALKMKNIKEKILILTATSGDTGKAALEGFKDVENIKILVFYPDEGVSKVQQKQMASQEGKNTFVFAVKGNFDDVQGEVKNIFTDEEIKEFVKDKGYSLSSANSINIGRLVPQIVYYFYSYTELVRNNELKEGEKVNFIVPSGNFGDILAGYYAKIMGLPVNKLICASNENNVLTEFLNTGVYNRNRPFYKTISPSMDILVSSNLERLIYHLSGEDDKYTAGLMKELKETGKYTVSENIKEKLKDEFYAGYSDEVQTKNSIKEVYEKFNYLMDTHTAVAYNIMKKFKQENGQCKNIILSTASPYKFSSAVYEALFGKAESENEFEIMKKLNEKTGVPIPENLKNLENKKDIHTRVIKKDEMREVLEVIL